MNYKPLAILPLMILTSLLIKAQSADVSLLSTGGGLSTTGSFTLSYSIGEPCISYVYNDMLWLTEGFQQPGKINLTAIDGTQASVYTFRIFPNPVTSQLHIESTDQGPWQVIQITNILGSSYPYTAGMNGRNMILNLDQLSAGLYFLVIRDHSSNLITHTFIKI